MTTSMYSYTEACPPRSSGTFQVLFNQLILSLLNSTCEIIKPYPADISLGGLEFTKFDFIVVGSGSSGSVIANRLTEVPEWEVLLIDVGHDPPIESDVPGWVPYVWEPPNIFQYYAEKTSQYCLGQVNQQCYLPRGRMIGGSSAANNMVYARGSPYDYDRWALLETIGITQVCCPTS